MLFESGKKSQKYPLVLRGSCWDGYYVYKVKYWLWISNAHWNLWSSVMRILTLKAYPKFCSLYIKEQELKVSGCFYYLATRPYLLYSWGCIAISAMYWDFYHTSILLKQIMMFYQKKLLEFKKYKNEDLMLWNISLNILWKSLFVEISSALINTS